ncbi:hypothetical protein AB0C60_31080, partial [Streptomyces sp. NPDC048845]
MIRVLLVHDTGLLRSALAALLGKEGDFDVASATWETIALWARSLRPEVFVVDADDPSPGGAPPAEERVGTLKGAVRNAACGASLLALVSPGCPGLRRAFDAGALGFVNKNSTPQRLVEGVRKVSRAGAGSALWSSLPLGVTGSGPSSGMTRAGTMYS